MILAPQIITSHLDTPEFAVPEANRIAVSDYLAQMMTVPPSRMFEIKNALTLYKQKNGPQATTYDASQGDGGASLPGVPVEVLDRAHKLQVKHGTGYDKPFGTDLFRTTAAERYWGFTSNAGWGPENIIFTQGGRDGLIKAYSAMCHLGHGRIGDMLVMSRVPWISYNWGPYGMGLNVLRAPGRPEEGWRYTSEGIIETVRFAQNHGRKIAGLIITSPDNPTGRTIPVPEQIDLARTAIENDVQFVLFDWIYHRVTDGGHSDINTVLGAFSPDERNRLMILDGITKSLGGSNIRSAQLVASKDVVKFITSQASHGVIPSFYAQAVAVAAYEMGFDKAAENIILPIRESRQVLRQILPEMDTPYIMGDGYYAFIDLTRYVEATDYNDTAGLGHWLGENYGVTIVPGVYFSQAGANWVRFSYALPPEKTEQAIQRLFEGLNALV